MQGIHQEREEGEKLRQREKTEKESRRGKEGPGRRTGKNVKEMVKLEEQCIREHIIVYW